MFRKKDVVFWNGYIPVTNMGDVVINSLILRELSNGGYLVRAYIPKQHSNLIQLIDFPNVRLINFVHYRFLIFVYGIFSFLTRTKVCYLRHPGHISGGRLAALQKYFLLERLWKIFNIKCIRLGNSLGTFSQQEIEVERKRREISFFYALRDSGSIERLGGHAVLVPDLAFLLPYIYDRKRKDYFVISFKVSHRLPDLQRVSSSLLDFHKEKVVSVAQVAEDKLFMERTLGLNVSITFSINDQTLEQILETYRDGEFVISNRLHSLLFGMSMGCVPVAVVECISNDKIIALFKDNDLQECLYFLDENSFPIEEMINIAKQEKSLILNKIKRMFLRNNEIINSILAKI